MKKILEMKGITKTFGGIAAVSEASIEVTENSIHGLIGPNGAGKTTVFNLISGVIKPTSGRIIFKDLNLNGLKAHERTALGICRTYQNVKLFASGTAIENVMVAMPFRMMRHLARLVTKLPFKEPIEERLMREEARELLNFVGLYENRSCLASALPFGDQRRLEVARALATRPTLLLLDEPCAGMNQAEKRQMVHLINEIKGLGKTVIVVEHDMKILSEICSTMTVLNFGRVIARGSPKAIQSNPDVIEAYLGQDDEAYWANIVGSAGAPDLIERENQVSVEDK